MYLRTEAKSIVNGRPGMEVLLFDGGMELIAVINQVAQIIAATKKDTKERGGRCTSINIRIV